MRNDSAHRSFEPDRRIASIRLERTQGILELSLASAAGIAHRYHSTALMSTPLAPKSRARALGPAPPNAVGAATMTIVTPHD